MNINTRYMLHHGNDNQMTQVIIHHTTSNLTLHQYRRFFRYTLGWVRCGYHYLIRKNGAVYQYTDERSRAWGAGAENVSAIHIALNGNFENQHPTAAQLTTLNALVRDICQRRNIPITRVRGHGRIQGQATACPGRNLPNSAWQNALRAQTPPANSNQTHTVASGDTLFAIARTHGTTVAAIQAANNMGTSTILAVGQRLTIPGTAPAITNGTRVRINRNARTWATGQNIPQWVLNAQEIYTITQTRANGNEALLSGINSWACIADLVAVYLGQENQESQRPYQQQPFRRAGIEGTGIRLKHPFWRRGAFCRNAVQ